MKDLLIARLTPVVFLLTVSLVGGGSARAQDLIPNKAREELTRPTIGSSKPKPVYVTRTRTVYVDRNAHPTITTGTLSVGALPNASILIEPVKGGVGKETTVPANESLVIIDNLKPGVYRVAATLAGYKQDEKRVDVVANKPRVVTLNLQPILYTVKINTNVTSGEVRYAEVETYTEPGTAEKRYRPKGETRVVELQNHSAELRALAKGSYGVDIRASEAGFETLLGTITVPDDTNKDEVKLVVELKNVRSTETFSALTSDQWDLPAGWSIASFLLSTSGNGMAIPHVESYRHYTDFQLISDAKMLNGVSVSFVARASANRENYYLVQLTGPNAEEPYLLSAYIVKHGVRERFQSIQIGHLRETLKPNKYFKVSITMKDNGIDVRLVDSQTGDELPLGILVDPNRNFTIGAVGIAGGEKDRAQFGSFLVCAPACSKQ
jgi:hypothetical protein